VLIYLWQEGRGQGILNKIKAMDVQRNHNYDTVEAFSHLSLDLDPRNYTIVEEVFKDLEVSTKIALITNNPNKLEYVKKIGYTVDQLIHLKYHRNDFVKKDLLVKKKKLGHIIPDL
jgi:3,4-dihydroxy 2-butanone 4-phosphate synthase/GTP cyclohydrolase II